MEVLHTRITIRPDLESHLMANRTFYAQAIFCSFDNMQIALLLSGLKIGSGTTKFPVAHVIDPTPVGYVANYLAFKTNYLAFGPDSVAFMPNIALDEDDKNWATWLGKRGIPQKPCTQTVPLGSGGVFAEATLGRSNCAEKLDITRFWNWQDSPLPILPTDIAPIQMKSLATTETLTPGQLSAPIVNMVQPSSLPNPTGTGNILSAMQHGDMFRDMSGLAATIALTGSAIQHNVKGATDEGKQAGANMETLLKNNTERQKIAADMVTSLAKTAASVYTARGTSSDDGAKINHEESKK